MKSYKEVKLKGLETINKALYGMAVSDNHIDNLKLIGCIEEVCKQLRHLENVQKEIEDLEKIRNLLTR